jgi:GH25 family lysozyme M1 (1,4-beta-N-acetylmuramidase)
VPGIEGDVDLDLFAGTLQDLEDFAKRRRITSR